VARGLRLYGLTGGIASGKSTVARMIAERGVPVIDADDLSREVMAPGQPATAEIAAAWPAVVDGGGVIDRKRLGDIVFADPAARLRLEAITHPRIQALGDGRVEALARQGYLLAFYEASLLVEAGRHRDFDGLVVVTAAPEAQVARAVARGRLTPDEARARIAAQLPLADKVRVATHVIINDGDLESTRAQVERLLADLRAAAPPPP
jgi:dephospho-CoA kinase